MRLACIHRMRLGPSRFCRARPRLRGGCRSQGGGGAVAIRGEAGARPIAAAGSPYVILHYEVARPAGHDQMLDAVAADEHKAPLLIHLRHIENL
jgi:hypothetical protein